MENDRKHLSNLVSSMLKLHVRKRQRYIKFAFLLIASSISSTLNSNFAAADISPSISVSGINDGETIQLFKTFTMSTTLPESYAKPNLRIAYLDSTNNRSDTFPSGYYVSRVAGCKDASQQNQGTSITYTANCVISLADRFYSQLPSVISLQPSMSYYLKNDFNSPVYFSPNILNLKLGAQGKPTAKISSSTLVGTNIESSFPAKFTVKGNICLESDAGCNFDTSLLKLVVTIGANQIQLSSDGTFTFTELMNSSNANQRDAVNTLRLTLPDSLDLPKLLLYNGSDLTAGWQYYYSATLPNGPVQTSNLSVRIKTPSKLRWGNALPITVNASGNGVASCSIWLGYANGNVQPFTGETLYSRASGSFNSPQFNIQGGKSGSIKLGIPYNLRVAWLVKVECKDKSNNVKLSPSSAVFYLI